MSVLERLNIGIVGACSRGASFKTGCDAVGEVRVHAVCDRLKDLLDASAEKMGAAEKYLDYEEMIEKSELDAVVVATPMPFHAEQSILALENGIHVLCEVTAAVSVEECRQLVQASKKSRAVYMLAENACYRKPAVMVKEMVRRGHFGSPYYAEGEYLHELKERDERRWAAMGIDLSKILLWRRKWQNGIDGITYGTHSLGPVLQWMPGDRVVSVCCKGSGYHHKDPQGRAYAQDTSVMLCKMRSGGLVKIRVDMISDRPHAQANYQLQGTDGCYESGRAAGERNRVWLKSRGEKEQWMTLEDLAEEFLPERYKAAEQAAQKAGHGGGDYFEVVDFIEAIQGKRTLEIGIHEAMDMSLPGLLSQQSIKEQGRWLEVPDTREW